MRRVVGILGLALPLIVMAPGTVYAQAQKDTPAAPAQTGAAKNADVFIVGDVPDPKAHGEYVGAPATVANVALAAQPLNSKTRLELIRVMQAEFAYTKKPIPRGEKGLTLPANGKLEESDAVLRDRMFKNGTSAHVGDRVQITNVQIQGKAIAFELNGGPRKKHKWYEHISVGASGGMATPMDPTKDTAPGSVLTLTFPKFVPEMSAAEVRALLAPVLDFSVKSPTLAYADTLPPKIRAAVLAHKALVGMNRDMVVAAVGRPDKKFRETDDGIELEDWMYGRPPADVRFLRFRGDELIRIKTMPEGGEAIVRDQPEVDETEIASIAKQKDDAQQKRTEAKEAAARPQPTLRREGDPPPLVAPQPGTVTVTSKPHLPGTTPPPGSGPSSNPGEVPQPGSAPAGAPPPMPGGGSPGGTGPQ